MQWDEFGSGSMHFAESRCGSINLNESGSFNLAEFGSMHFVESGSMHLAESGSKHFAESRSGKDWHQIKNSVLGQLFKYGFE
jgi:hypothetical protein